MLFRGIDMLDEHFVWQKNVHVGVHGDRIAYIGKELPTGDFGEIYDGSAKLLLPGFFNSHAHTPMVLMRGYGENLALHDWLTTRIFPFEAGLTANDVYYATLLGYAESLRYGIVSTTDMYYFCDEMARAAIETGVKANIGRGVTSFTDEDLYQSIAFRETKELYENYHESGDGRIKIDISLHAEYTSTPRAVRQLADYARKIDGRMHVHLSETKIEHEECKTRHQKTPAAYFADLGLFDVPTTAAHCVWVEDDDIAILKDKGVTVASNPISNLKLASGICPVHALRAAGVPVALGTDSVASNNSLNFIEEIKAFALLAKQREADPTVVTPVQALQAATRSGALAQGRSDSGLLKTGYRADLAVLDLSGPQLHPVYDMATHVVYSASGSDICLTMVDGKILYRDGLFPTIDMERVRFETAGSAARLSAGASS
ncbi:MAG TPA: amidohydrolase [Clostridiales bacterium]|nr:amidohydrolase [Clostridiales bacterium]